LGVGGFSKVYLSRNQKGKLFAMKMIDKEFVIMNQKKYMV
jgi:serine/threonine protein kinase